MKHFTLIAGAALLAAMPAAAAPAKGPAHNPHKITRAQKAPARALPLNARSLDISRLHTVMPAASRSESEPLFEVEGESQLYSVDALGYVQAWGELYFEPATDMKDVVWGEGNTVYFRNFVNIGVDSYVAGTVSDGKITIQFPQVVFYADAEDGYPEQILSLNVLEYDEDAEYMYKNVEADQTQLVIDIAEDGSMSWNLNPDYDYYDDFMGNMDLPTYIVGLTELTEPGTSDWFGYGDCNQDYTVFDLESVTPPADAQFDRWVLEYTNDNGSRCGSYVDVAFSGSDIYVGNIHEDVPGWIKGTVSGSKAYFESGQYVGYCALYSSPIYFLTATFEEVYYEEYDWWDFHVEFNEGLTFNYDIKNKTLSLEASEPAPCFVLNANPDELSYLEIYIDPELRWQDPALCNAAPLDPEFLEYQPWDPEFYGGQGGIFWNIPAINVNGAVLETSKMYYHFIVDGEVYGIDPEEYTFVEEYMEDIPYDYTDGIDIWAMGDYHEIYFYFDGAESLGLQSFYVGDDGVTYESGIVTYFPETGETTGIDAIEAAPVAEKFYGIDGREAANPAHGLYIKAVKLSDGSVRTFKVVVK